MSILTLFAIAGCNNKPDEPVIKFEQVTTNIGHIKSGAEPVTINFKFSNTGKKPLQLLNVAADCTCTVPSFTKNTVEGDEAGTIKVVFNPKAVHSTGVVERKIVVYSNTQPKLHTLIIKMFVDK